MSLYENSVPQFIKMLKNLDKWFDKAEAHAKARGFDSSVYLTSRLAPDQFAFTRQVQIACDAAKNGSARVTGKTPPAFADNETTLAELRTRIQKTLTYLETFSAQDFEGVETRKVPLPAATSKVALGKDALFEYVIPTFYFHATTAYAILRHNGVELGKADYLGGLTSQEA